MNTELDLRQLTVKREGTKAPSPPHRGHIVTRYVLPGVILLGFLTVLGWAARDSLLPAKSVTVVPVLATRAEIQQSGTPLFQSAGWVEARPTPVVVTALAEGIVDQLLVVEGQEVKAGQTVARLINADARLALAAAEVELQQREAEADILLARTETDLLFLPFQLQSAEAQDRLAQIDYERRQKAVASVPEISIFRSESDLTMARAKFQELKFRKQRLEREVRSLQQMSDAFHKGETWRPEQPLTDTEASMRANLLRVRQAQVSVDSAQLRLERMTVKAPCSGRVLALVARPGTRLMGLALGTAQESSTVITLYDPENLQVRADIRLEDVPRLQTGQPVRIETPAVPGGHLDGEMLFATAITDIQKNTLQVKVAIKSPPPALKPDMLVQATFLAPEPTGKTASLEQLRLFVPRQLVESSQAGARIWIADSTARKARLKSIKLGQGTHGDLVEIVEGLNAADKVISTGREGLTDGQRIAITGDDVGGGTITQEHKAEPKRLPVASKEGTGATNKK